MPSPHFTSRTASNVLSTRRASPPPYLVVDTSAFVAALIADTPGHDDYATFFERCAYAGTVLAYCELVDLELAEAAIRIELGRRHGRKANAARRDGRLLRPARAYAVKLREAFTDLLSGFDAVRIPISQSVHVPDDDGYWETAPLTSRAVALVEQCGLGSYDAAHALCALVTNAPLLARDVGFARFGGIVLITDPARTGPARRIRFNNRAA